MQAEALTHWVGVILTVGGALWLFIERQALARDREAIRADVLKAVQEKLDDALDMAHEKVEAAEAVLSVQLDGLKQRVDNHGNEHRAFEREQRERSDKAADRVQHMVGELELRIMRELGTRIDRAERDIRRLQGLNGRDAT